MIIWNKYLCNYIRYIIENWTFLSAFSFCFLMDFFVYRLSVKNKGKNDLNVLTSLKTLVCRECHNTRNWITYDLLRKIGSFPLFAAAQLEFANGTSWKLLEKYATHRMTVFKKKSHTSLLCITSGICEKYTLTSLLYARFLSRHKRTVFTATNSYVQHGNNRYLNDTLFNVHKLGLSLTDFFFSLLLVEELSMRGLRYVCYLVLEPLKKK